MFYNIQVKLKIASMRTKFSIQTESNYNSDKILIKLFSSRSYSKCVLDLALVTFISFLRLKCFTLIFR